MNIYLSSRARRDLQRAFDFIAIDNPFAAQRIQDDILEAVQSLAQFPERGRPGRAPGLRELVLAVTG